MATGLAAIVPRAQSASRQESVDHEVSLTQFTSRFKRDFVTPADEKFEKRFKLWALAGHDLG